MYDDNKLMTISEFARLSGIRRKNLIFYDEIGLFAPAKVGENGYRYYTYRQFDTATMIWALKEIGVPLKEIKAYTSTRTPGRMLDLFRQQIGRVEEDMRTLARIRTMMRTHIRITEEALAADPGSLSIRRLEAEPVAYGPMIDYADGKTATDALAVFYDDDANRGPAGSDPLGAQVPLEGWEDPQAGRLPRRYYFRRPDGPDEKPAGLYAIGHGLGDYGETGPLYGRLLAFIEAEGFQPAGDAYETYVINELSTVDPADYLFRIEIPVARAEPG